ncbi:MAG: hypothetical protein K8T89_08245, partial [Planctomycetes bacterium]|nr:hypothetical protein [Planctomycetota bacterium]
MTALELLQQGQLREALAVQESQVLEHPGDPAGLLLLAELCHLDGDLEVVKKHLAELPRTLPGLDAYLQHYFMLLAAEEKRRRLLIDLDPGFVLTPPDSLLARLEAVQCVRDGKLTAAIDQLDVADEMSTWLTGHIDGREFDEARDCDDLFGPVLELYVQDDYVWFPFEQVKRLRIGDKQTLRDRFIVPARLTTFTDEEWSVHLPALYPDSHLHADDEIRIGQGTDWLADSDGPLRGVGMRTL